MDRGQRIALGVGASLTLGSAALLFYRWQKRQSEPPPPQDFKPPFMWQPGLGPPDPKAIYASLTKGRWVEDIGGGWLLLDASAIRDPGLNPDRDAHVGMLATLILQYKTAPPKVFSTKILNISGDDYAGQWITQPPAGGPQLIDFRGANIFTLRKP